MRQRDLTCLVDMLESARLAVAYLDGVARAEFVDDGSHHP